MYLLLNTSYKIFMDIKTKKKFKMPHVCVLLSILVIAVFILTFIIPSGQFERIADPNTGRTVVQNNSYHVVEKEYLSLLDLPMSVVNGLNKSSSIIFFILIIGGAFQVITVTQVFDALTYKISNKFGKQSNTVIGIFVIFFSILGFTMGASQEVIIFIPIGVAVARSLGYDAITGAAMMQLGGMCGFTAGLLNPFNVGVAQGIAGLELYSGLWYRAIILVVFLIITIWYIVRYANKIKANPELSYCAELELEEKDTVQDLGKEIHLTKRHICIILTFVLGLFLLIWGIRKKDWFINEMSAVFLVMGIISGKIGKMAFDDIAKEFIEGARALVFGILIIGIASSVIVVLEKGMILDTAINGIFNFVNILPVPFRVVGIYLSQIVINFFIISGTAQAAVVMPILLPLGDLLNITRQTSVLAFQLGDGFTNYIFPTSSTLMAILAVAKIKYEAWVKFSLPLMVIFTVVCGIFVYIASIIGYA